MGKPTKTSATYVPPNNLTPTLSTSSNHTMIDLRRDKSSTAFTPAPAISGPIPPLPKRHPHTQNQQQTLSTKTSSSSLTGQTGSGRRPSRETSGGSGKFHPPTLDPKYLKSNISAPIQGTLESTAPNSPTPSMRSFSPTSSTLSSISSSATPPRGSVSSASSKSHEISGPMLKASTNNSTSVRSSIYSTMDDNQSLAASKNSKSTEFYLERPTDEAEIEQMFNDLIVG